MAKLLISLALAGTLAVAGTTPVLYASSPHTPSPSSARLVGARIVSVALSYVGYRYAYAGDTPATGFSCVGFVHWVYSQFGYNTPEDPGMLYYSYRHIAPAAMQPGDVLIFANTVYAGFSHAAIYIGGGRMVGADNFDVGVHIDVVYDAYWGSHFVGAVRIAPYATPTQRVAGATQRRTATAHPHHRTATAHPQRRTATAHRSSSRRPRRRPVQHSIRHH